MVAGGWPGITQASGQGLNQRPEQWIGMVDRQVTPFFDSAKTELGLF